MNTNGETPPMKRSERSKIVETKDCESNKYIKERKFEFRERKEAVISPAM